MTAAQAAARLGVKPATLYAYVSRGLILRHVAEDGRTSLFDPADLAKLERRSSRRRGRPADVIVASDLTLVDIEAGRVFYRGLDPVDACRTRRFEEIAGWLWTGNFDGTGVWRSPPGAELPEAPPLERVRLCAARFATRSSPVVAAGELMSSLVDALPGRGTRGTFAERLWTKLGGSSGDAKLLDTALSLTADHGLTYSSLIARVAAAAGADIAYCVTAAMSAAIAPSRFASIEAALERDEAVEDEPAPIAVAIRAVPP